MPITRISGCKGTTFLLFYKELRKLFVDFAQPFLQFARPLAFVGKLSRYPQPCPPTG